MQDHGFSSSEMIALSELSQDYFGYPKTQDEICSMYPTKSQSIALALRIVSTIRTLTAQLEEFYGGDIAAAEAEGMSPEGEMLIARPLYQLVRVIDSCNLP